MSIIGSYEILAGSKMILSPFLLKYFKVVPDPGTIAHTISPFFNPDKWLTGSIKTVSPSAIQASIIESPLTHRA